MKTIKHRMQFKLLALAGILVLMLSFTACSKIGQAVDPAEWGYEAEVKYDALQGVVNNRRIRSTNYMPGSLLFEPSGTTGLLVAPRLDGHILAGWYTDYTETTNENGDVEYQFNPEDRWDFSLDRVEDDITLYARWIPMGKAVYINAENGDVLFEKNVTKDSPVQALSDVSLKLVGPKDVSFEGYYADPELKTPYNFEEYKFSELLPNEKDVYIRLAEEHPDLLEEYVPDEEEKEVLEELVTDEGVVTEDKGTENAAGPEGTPEDLNTEEVPVDPYFFIKAYGYNLVDDSDETIAKLRAAKNDIYEEYIQAYVDNSAQGNIYLNFISGKGVTVKSEEDMKVGKTYGFFAKDEKGLDIEGYEIESNLDFADMEFKSIPEYSGVIKGNGHTIDNITLKITGSKRDLGKTIEGALFLKLKGAEIRDLTIKTLTIQVTVPKMVSAKAAPIAISAEGSIIENVTIENLVIDTGKFDGPTAGYEFADFIFETGDSELNGIKVEKVTFESEHASFQQDYSK